MSIILVYYLRGWPVSFSLIKLDLAAISKKLILKKVSKWPKDFLYVIKNYVLIWITLIVLLVK